MTDVESDNLFRVARAHVETLLDAPPLWIRSLPIADALALRDALTAACALPEPLSARVSDIHRLIAREIDRRTDEARATLDALKGETP